MSRDKYQLRPEVIPMLLKLAVPITEDEVVGFVCEETGMDPAAARDMFTLLERDGIIARQPDAGQSSLYTLAYGGGILNHRGMLRDAHRTDAFRRAIEEVVRAGDVVIDVGAGTGVLSLFAERAGAGRVLLVEETAVIEDAEALARANGLGRTFEYHRTNAAGFDADVTADVILSEWIGFFLMEEYMYGAFTSVRDRFLAPGGRVMPSAARLFLAPIDDERLYQQHGFGFWEEPAYGLDFRLGKEQHLAKLRRQVADVPPESLLTAPWCVLSLDCRVDSMDAFHFERSAELDLTRSGTITGFVGYFELTLSDSVILDTSPSAPPTHWHQVYLPASKLAVREGDRLAIRLTTSPGGIAPDLRIAGDLLRGDQSLRSFEHAYRGRLF